MTVSKLLKVMNSDLQIKRDWIKNNPNHPELNRVKTDRDKLTKEVETVKNAASYYKEV